MKKILIIIMVLSLLVGCSKNENVNNGGAASQEEVKNESRENANNTQENIEEEVEEEISVLSTITFPSKDGLLITADTYIIDDTSDFMVLFHQSSWSRGEYRKTAYKFNELGYNVMAVDLRSGNAVNDITNETAQRAIDEDYPNSGTDSGVDMQASIEYVRDEFKCDSMYILGSSYSAALVLAVGPEYQEVLKGIIAFSPIVSQEWNDIKVKDHISNLTVPVFMTSNKAEMYVTDYLFPFVASEVKVQYKPETRGKHGASVLWDTVKDNAKFWEALTAFLEDIKS